MRIRVVTLNVWNTQGDARRISLINQELRALQPDIISLQEVVQSENIRMLDEILEGLDIGSIHQVDLQRFLPPFADQYGGTAIASKWPMRPLEALDLRLAEAPDVPWATLAAAVDVPNEGEMLFIAATTAWRPSAEAARERQVQAIVDLDLRHRRALPTIIAGDFNADPDSSSMRFLTGRQSLGGRSVLYHDAWDIAGEGVGFTWTSDNPNAKAGIDQIIRQSEYHRRFDYVLVGSWDGHPKAHALVHSAQVAFDKPRDGIWLSDHFGVVAEIDVGL